MKRIHTAIVLVIYTCNILLVIGLDKRYCFQFTWRGPNDATANCTKNIPCIKPFYNCSTEPNMSEIWDKNKDNIMASEFFCELNPGSVCIKYTYKYNNAVVNASYFCGKVIEDQTSAIISGCYAQHTEGYIIEACACQSRYNSIPCNTTIRNTYSILVIIGATIVTLFMYKIFNIP